jgi:hypothetical protein
MNIFASAHKPGGEFDGAGQFFIFIFLEIIFTILIMLLYEILRKEEKNGHKYNVILITPIVLFIFVIIYLFFINK